MRRKIILINLIFFAVLCVSLKAQNLVPNYSFEDTIKCPTGQQFTGYISNWFGGYDPIDFNRYCHDAVTGEIPANVCGHQYPHSGNAYVGIYTFLKTGDSDTSARDYIEVQLTSALLPSVKYFVTFYVSLADTFKYACNDIGALFSDSIINCNGYVTYHIPQIENDTANHLTDKLNWVKVSGNFIAQGGEKYITIGNFRNDGHSDTVFVNSTAPAGYAPAAYYYLDDVIVSPDSNYADSIMGVQAINVSKSISKVYPNPANAQLTVEVQLDGGATNTICLYSSIGEIVKCETLVNNITTVNTGNLSMGIYYYRITDIHGKLIKADKIALVH